MTADIFINLCQLPVDGIGFRKDIWICNLIKKKALSSLFSFVKYNTLSISRLISTQDSN